VLLGARRLRMPPMALAMPMPIATMPITTVRIDVAMPMDGVAKPTATTVTAMAHAAREETPRPARQNTPAK